MSMWEPFTERARRSIVLAQEEAQRLGNNYIGTEHILLGIISEGESLAAKEKKLECVVSGGLGKIRIDFKGTTYYVCCTGCRDAFLENPEKYIKEYEARKAGRK